MIPSFWATGRTATCPTFLFMAKSTSTCPNLDLNSVAIPALISRSSATECPSAMPDGVSLKISPTTSVRLLGSGRNDLVYNWFTYCSWMTKFAYYLSSLWLNAQSESLSRAEGLFWTVFCGISALALRAATSMRTPFRVSRIQCVQLRSVS
jgi:hypothetical protein